MKSIKTALILMFILACNLALSAAIPAEVNAVTAAELTISGTITYGGSPLAGVVMSGLPGDPVPVTNASGFYTAAVDSGWEGTVTPTLAGYTFAPASRDYTNVTSDQSGQDYEATLLCGISGRVTAEDGGSGIENVRVIVRNLSNQKVKNGGTDGSGNYTIGLAPGNYKVNFNTDNTSSGSFVAEWYDNQGSFATATQVVVNAGQITANIDAELKTGMTISGRVTDSQGNGIAEIEIYPYTPDGNQFGYGCSDENGYYKALGMPGGTYKLNFNSYWVNDSYGSNYKDEWYNDKNDFAHADQLTVAAGLTLSGVDAVLTEGGIISGRVTNESGVGVSGVTVEVFKGFESIDNWFEAYTDADGNYQVKGIPSGTYYVWFLQTEIYISQVYDNVIDVTDMNDATQLEVTAGNTIENINAVLKIGGKVTGRVTDTGGNGIPKVRVQFHDAATNTYWIRHFGTTDANGYYTSNPLTPGQYKAYFQEYEAGSGAHCSEYYNDKTTMATADVFQVTAGATTENINAVLDKVGGTISGYVRNAVGQPLQGAAVELYDLDSPGSYLGAVYTNADGYFELKGLIAGQYKLYCYDYGIHPSEWYDNKAAFAAANTVTVSAGGNTQIEIVLGDVLSLMIAGTITAGGSPLASVVMNGLPGNPTTNASGVYSATVDYNWSGTVTPTLAGYTFSPVNRTYTTVTADQTAQDYTAGLIITDLITVTSPNGGESWMMGSAHNITWISTGTIVDVKVEYSTNSGTGWTTVVVSTPNNGSYAWTVPYASSMQCLVRVSDASNAAIFDVSDAVFTIVRQKDDLLGTWAGQGVYYRNSDTGAWVKLSSPATKIAAGDLDGDGIDDLIGIWPTQGGVWVKYSKTAAWAKLSTTADWISAGDMNGDGKDDLLGTWATQGVFYRNSADGVWVKMSTPATKTEAGDLDGDGIDDLIGIWPTQGGVWVKYSKTAAWAKLSTTADWISAGDMNGDGKDDLLGTWATQGVYYRNSANGAWVKMSTPATKTDAGDLDGDGIDDLIGIWPTQGGVWVKYSKTAAWAKLSSTADWISTGRMRTAGATLTTEATVPTELIAPLGGYATGPGEVSHLDYSDWGPGGPLFVYEKERNLAPRQADDQTPLPGPGEPGFKCLLEKNLIPPYLQDH